MTSSSCIIPLILFLTFTPTHTTPSDVPLSCSTDILMSFYSTDPEKLWKEYRQGNSWWESGNAYTTILLANQPKDDWVGEDVYNRSYAACPWNPSYAQRYYSYTSNDDSLWWCIAMIDLHLSTQQSRTTQSEGLGKREVGEGFYLDNAIYVWFNILKNGWDDVFGGGVWWTDVHGLSGYKNSITNELFMFAATQLYLINSDPFILSYAHKTMDWFLKSGLIVPDNHYLINDGLNSSGLNNGQETWTYNQGVILGALADMYTITGDVHYLSLGINISSGVMKYMIDGDGILTEACAPCSLNADQRSFKGVFMRHLRYFYQHVLTASIGPNRDAYLSLVCEFIDTNYVHVMDDTQNTNNFNTCGDGGNTGVVWQAEGEQILSGYTSSISVVELLHTKSVTC